MNDINKSEKIEVDLGASWDPVIIAEEKKQRVKKAIKPKKVPMSTRRRIYRQNVIKAIQNKDSKTLKDLINDAKKTITYSSVSHIPNIINEVIDNFDKDTYLVLESAGLGIEFCNYFLYLIRSDNEEAFKYFLNQEIANPSLNHYHNTFITNLPKDKISLFDAFEITDEDIPYGASINYSHSKEYLDTDVNIKIPLTKKLYNCYENMHSWYIHNNISNAKEEIYKKCLKYKKIMEETLPILKKLYLFDRSNFVYQVQKFNENKDLLLTTDNLGDYLISLLDINNLIRTINNHDQKIELINSLRELLSHKSIAKEWSKAQIYASSVHKENMDSLTKRSNLPKKIIIKNTSKKVNYNNPHNNEPYKLLGFSEEDLASISMNAAKFSTNWPWTVATTDERYMEVITLSKAKPRKLSNLAPNFLYALIAIGFHGAKSSPFKEKTQNEIINYFNDPYLVFSFTSNTGFKEFLNLLTLCPKLQLWQDKKGNNICHYIAAFNEPPNSYYLKRMQALNKDLFFKENNEGYSFIDVLKINNDIDPKIMNLLIKKSIKESSVIDKKLRQSSVKKLKM